MFNNSDFKTTTETRHDQEQAEKQVQDVLLKAGEQARGSDTDEPRMEFDSRDQGVQLQQRPRVKTDPSRDALLTEFGKATLLDRYLIPGETFQDLFARVASYYGDDDLHAQRLYDYISKLWFMPATPIL